MEEISMRGFTNNLVVFALNDSTEHWCDHAMQTIQLLSQKNTVVVFCLGNYITWKDCFSFRRSYGLFERKWNALLYHPLFIIPGQRFSLIKKINFIINAWFMNVWLLCAFQKKKKYFWFFDPYHIASIIKIFSRYISVYDCVDYYSDVSLELGISDKFLFSYATHVFANSQALAKKIQSQRKTVTVVPLGFADNVFCHYSVLKETNKKKTVGFVGGITPRMDFPLLINVAKRLPHIEFVFYGKIVPALQNEKGEFPSHAIQLFSLPNVHLKGYVSKQEVPTIIASFDVAIIPYTTDSFNTYCFPMKTMEYFYMGKPVVSTPILELERFSTFVHIAHTSRAWERCINTLISTPWSQSSQKAQRKIAMANTWKKKLDRMISVICATRR